MMEPKAIVDFDTRLTLPNHALIIGATQSGKSTLVLNLISNARLFTPPPKKIIFYYDQMQDKYLETKRKLATEGIELLLCKGFPKITLEDIPKEDYQTILIVDDFSEEASSSKELARIATNGRHKNLSLWIILHSLFNKSPESRTIAQNVRWFFFLPSVRLESQLRTFGSQLGMKDRLVYAFKKVQEDPCISNRYLTVDTGPQTPDIMRVRSHVHDPVRQYVFM